MKLIKWQTIKGVYEFIRFLSSLIDKRVDKFYIYTGIKTKLATRLFKKGVFSGVTECLLKEVV